MSTQLPDEQHAGERGQRRPRDAPGSPRLGAEAGGVDGALKKGMDEFGARFKKRFNADVQIYAPYVYDAVNVMVDAMVRANSTRPSAYLPELAKSNYKGVTGTIAFDNKGDIRNGALTLYTFKAGKKYKYRKMKELFIEIADKNSDIQSQRIEDEFTAWKGELEQVDDVLVFGIKI